MDRDSRNPAVWLCVVVIVACIGVMGWLTFLTQAKPARSALAAEAPVEIGDFYFDPAVLTVSVGATVVWYNVGQYTHTVSIPGEADSGDIPPGETFAHTFNSLGLFPYYCSHHPSMQGVIYAFAANQVPVDLSVGAYHDEVVGPGATIGYHVLCDNNHWSNDAQNAVLTVTLPAASTAFTSTRSGNPFPPSSILGNTLIYQLGVVPAYSTQVIDLDVQLTDTLRVGDIASLAARISAANPDPDHANNYTEDPETVPGANVTLFKRLSEDSGPFVAGGTVTYTLEYANQSDIIAAASVVITDLLPAGTTFVSASPIVPAHSGNWLTFTLGTLNPLESGELLVQVRITDSLVAKTPLTNTARISTASAESAYDDNSAFEVQVCRASGPDLWILLGSVTDGILDGYQRYWLDYGNAGPQDANGVTLTLTIPSALDNLDFDPTPPDALITTSVSYTATWYAGTLSANTYAGRVEVMGVLSTTGQITATAYITTSNEADPSDNRASTSDYIALILMPTIAGPSGATVGPDPVFYGLGTAGATVTLYLSGTVGVLGGVIGSAVVDDDANWVITPTTMPTVPEGWYWFTATQQFDGRVSDVAGVGNYISPTLPFDTNSMTRDGERVGGINQQLGWRRETTYTLGICFSGCANPLTPTVRMLVFNADDVMIGYQDFTAVTVVSGTGHAIFEILTPDSDMSFELYIRYFCPIRGTALANKEGFGPISVAGLWRDLKAWFGCWAALGCDPKPDPPAPPPPCRGCTPIPRPGPRPKTTDPDGFVYDEASAMAGATITQSILTRATVTATQRTAFGQFAVWRAELFGQFNPQVTDGTTQDGVLRLGYYSFLVPPGDYRIQVTASGYLPFESRILQVITTPVTLHVPMKRTNLAAVPITPRSYRVYLPIVMRQQNAPMGVCESDLSGCGTRETEVMQDRR